MQRKRQFLLLVVLCTLVLASTVSGVPNVAASSHIQSKWTNASEGDWAPDAPPTQEPPSDPGGTPPDDNWDGVAPVLAAPQEAEPVAPLADRNLGPDASVSEAPPTPAPLAPPVIFRTIMGHMFSPKMVQLFSPKVGHWVFTQSGPRVT
jgi:hypothetical protein